MCNRYMLCDTKGVVFGVNNEDSIRDMFFEFKNKLSTQYNEIKNTNIYYKSIILDMIKDLRFVEITSTDLVDIVVNTSGYLTTKDFKEKYPREYSQIFI